MPNEEDADNPLEDGFTDAEFRRIVQRISNVAPLDDSDEAVIASIKAGTDLPFIAHDQFEAGLHFGKYEGAYYGQRYRNNRLGVIEAESLNLRSFYYLITRLRDGKILVGVTYHGQFGDYDGLRACLSHLLRGNYRVASKTLRNVSSEIGRGHPVSLKLTYRKAADRAERRTLFGTAGVLAIKNTDYGEDFEGQVQDIARQLRGPAAQRKEILARIVNQGEMLELDEDDIIGCSAVVREEGRLRTVYFLGDNNFSTKFPLEVEVDVDGESDPEQVRQAMVRVMREHIVPLLA